jgi:hypothetical protein
MGIWAVSNIASRSKAQSPFGQMLESPNYKESPLGKFDVSPYVLNAGTPAYKASPKYKDEPIGKDAYSPGGGGSI